MKILYVNHMFYPAVGGIALHTKQIAEKFVCQGDRVTILCCNALNTTPSGQHEFLPEGVEWVNGIKVIRISSYTWFQRQWRTFAKFWAKAKLPYYKTFKAWRSGPSIKSIRVIAHIKADIVVVKPFPSIFYYYAYFANFIRRRPLVLFTAFHEGDGWILDTPLMRQVFKSCDGIEVLTEYEKEVLVKKGFDEEKIFCSGIGIDLAQIPTGVDRSFRQRFARDDEPVVLFVGRHQEGKGILHLIDSMELVWRSVPSARLVIAGKTSDFTKRIHDRISRIPSQFRPNIILINNFPEETKYKIFAACDIFAMPSKVDSFGGVYLEAWAHCKPVIGCWNTPCASVITDGKDGLLVEYGNAKKIAEAILGLIKNPELRLKLGKQGRNKIERQYNWDNIVRITRANYSKVIQRFYEEKYREVPNYGSVS